MYEMLKEIRKNGYKRLKNEELFNYYEKILRGDEDAKYEFIIRNVYLVAYIIRKHTFYSPWMVDDLLSIGIEKVIQCVNNKLQKENLETFKAYLFITIKYSLIGYLQKEYAKTKKTEYYLEKINDSDETSFEFFLEDKKIDINKYVSKLDFENAINELSKIELLIIIESCIDNLSLTEIAQKHHLKSYDVSFIKKCALKKLSDKLSDYVYEIKNNDDDYFLDWCEIVDKIKK